MKSQSLVLKIFRSLLGRHVNEGDVVTVPVDLVMAHDGSGPVIVQSLTVHGIKILKAANRTIFVFDHYFPPTTEREADLHAMTQAFAEKYGIALFKGQGISHQILQERGLISPGTVFVGADSHTCSAGAFGAFAIGLGATDVAAVIASGCLWIEVPKTLYIRLIGKKSSCVSGYDLALAVLGQIGCRGALGKVIEFTGPAVSTITMSDRFKLSNITVETGAVAGIFGIDAHCRDWLKVRKSNLSSSSIVPLDVEGTDADLEIDLSSVVPMVALPSSPDKVVPIDKCDKICVNQVFLGSCIGGLIEDLQIAAKIVKGKRIHPYVRMLVAPASVQVMRTCIANRTIDDLIQAGAVILPPGCGACLGKFGFLGDGEVGVATQNRNFVGRAGSRTSRIFLASASTAARAAITGYLDTTEITK